MKAKRLSNGNLLVPARAEDPLTHTIGDGMIEITADHPDYDAWIKWMASDAAKAEAAEVPLPSKEGFGKAWKGTIGDAARASRKFAAAMKKAGKK